MHLEYTSCDNVDMTNRNRSLFMEEDYIEILDAKELRTHNSILLDYNNECCHMFEIGKSLTSRGPSVMETIRGIVPFKIMFFVEGGFKISL